MCICSMEKALGLVAQSPCTFGVTEFENAFFQTLCDGFHSNFAICCKKC